MTDITGWCARAGAFAAIALFSTAAMAQGQSTLLPPECKGKTSAALDQCVRELTVPTGSEFFEPIEQKTDPRALLNCNLINRADQGFCISRNEIILECRKPARYSDFNACANRLIVRLQSPRAADCARAAPGQREACVVRNKVMGECLKEPWLYFICLGEKLYPR